MKTFEEIQKLHEMLNQANIPHTFKPLWDGLQIRLYADEAMADELDDCVMHSSSCGFSKGLLETYALNECEGYETAEQVFNGWLKMYQKTNEKKTTTCDCTIIGAGGEVWEGSAPSWD